MKLPRPIWENQNGCNNHFLFQCVEALLAFFCPTTLTIFLQQLLHGYCNLIISFNELPVVACVSQRSAQLFDYRRGGGRSTIMAILDGSTKNPCLHTICPNRSPNGENKMHFFRFKEIWHCLHLSNISLRHSI
jgi:hypothetical protein